MLLFKSLYYLKAAHEKAAPCTAWSRDAAGAHRALLSAFCRSPPDRFKPSVSSWGWVGTSTSKLFTWYTLPFLKKNVLLNISLEDLLRFALFLEETWSTGEGFSSSIFFTRSICETTKAIQEFLTVLSSFIERWHQKWSGDILKIFILKTFYLDAHFGNNIFKNLIVSKPQMENKRSLNINRGYWLYIQNVINKEQG